MSIAVLSGSFTSTGQSDSTVVKGCFNLSLSGFGSATVVVERSFDRGSTWVSVESFTADAQRVGVEPENTVMYRLNCTAYSSGTINYRISK